jgi:hypothetical protein
MKKTFLTIALAATGFVLSQPAAVAKSSKDAAKTTAAKTHHKKHGYKH